MKRNPDVEVYCQGHKITRPQRAPQANPWPGNPNAYPCPWGCNGTGDLPWFAHVAGGECFGCHGAGWILGKGSRQPTPKPTPKPGRRWRRDGGRIIQA